MADGRGQTAYHLGDVQFNAKTGDYFRKDIQFPFFEHYLKGKGTEPPEA